MEVGRSHSAAGGVRRASLGRVHHRRWPREGILFRITQSRRKMKSANARFISKTWDETPTIEGKDLAKLGCLLVSSYLIA